MSVCRRPMHDIILRVFLLSSKSGAHAMENYYSTQQQRRKHSHKATPTAIGFQRSHLKLHTCTSSTWNALSPECGSSMPPETKCSVRGSLSKVSLRAVEPELSESPSHSAAVTAGFDRAATVCGEQEAGSGQSRRRPQTVEGSR